MKTKLIIMIILYRKDGEWQYRVNMTTFNAGNGGSFFYWE